MLASIGYMCDDPYTGASGVTRVADNVYRVTTRLATRKASSVVTFTLRLMEPFETARQVFSPLLVRFLSGVDHTTRPVKISDSGRIRNEMQTMIPQALEHANDRIRVRFERINEMVLSTRQAGQDPRSARLVQDESPGLVRLARSRVKHRRRRSGLSAAAEQARDSGQELRDRDARHQSR